MDKAKKGIRDIGAEILEGIREIKRGEIGRVVTFPPVAETRAGWSGRSAAPLLPLPYAPDDRTPSCPLGRCGLTLEMPDEGVTE